MSDAVTQKLLDIVGALTDRERQVRTLRVRMIQAISEITSAESLAEFHGLDQLILDVTSLSSLRLDVKELLRAKRDLGNA